MDLNSIARAQQVLRVQLVGFSRTFERERTSVASVLGATRSFQKLSKPILDFDDLCKRIAIILPNERELKTLQKQRGSRISWLITSLLMKSDFIVAHSNRFIQEIEEFSQNTWHSRIESGESMVSHMKWDLFICHASEDKAEVAEPLAKMLQAKDLKVWYDKFTLSVGDSLRRKIDEGLANSPWHITSEVSQVGDIYQAVVRVTWKPLPPMPKVIYDRASDQ